MLCSILQFDHRQDMSGLTTPTLIIQSSNDNAVPPGVAGYLHKTIAGSWLVLYFYPKDDTPGCTKEACAFRDEFAAFKSKNAVVLGVSVDPVKSHDKFVEKYKLPFTLLADEDKKIVEAYGVWGQKSFLGKKYMGIHRVTFLIGPDGRIKKIWLKVKPTEHAAEVLAAI